MQKKNLHRHKVSKFIIGFAPHHRALKLKKKCKFCLNVAKSNVLFWSVTKQCKRPPQLFETNYDIVYNILFVPFFPFLKHYASKNYFVALLKTKIGAHFIDINLRQKKKKKIIFLFSWIWIDVMIFFVCIVFLLTEQNEKCKNKVFLHHTIYVELCIFILHNSTIAHNSPRT